MTNTASDKTVIDALAADDKIFVDDTSASGATKSFTPQQMADFVSLEAGSGDVVGPASATDNAVARFNSTTGKLIQNSGVTIDDSDNIAANNLSGTNTGDQTTEEIQDAAWDVLTGTQTLITVTYQDGTNDVDFVVDNDLANYSNATSGFITATLTDEQVQDITGAMVTGNTETLITVTYQDGDGTLDFVVDNDLANYSNATSAFITDITGDNLSALADVTITAIGSGELLKWSGSAWINNTLSEAGIQPLDATLTAWAAYNTNGILTQTSADTFTGRTITAGDAKISITNGDGVSGNPTVDFGSVASTDLSDTSSIVLTTQDNTFGDGTRQTFNPDATKAGINIGAHTAAPSSPTDGDQYLNSTTNQMFGRINGAWVDLGAGAGGGIDNVVEDTSPQLGGFLDCNGFNITDVHELRIDAIPDTDHTANGLTTNSINAGVTTAIGELLYLASDGEWALADADAEATASGSLAISLAVGSDGSPLLVALAGSFVRDDTYAWTVGADLYVSTTAGGLTETAPSGTGDIVRIVGQAVSADVVYFNPDSAYAEVA